MKYRFQQTSSYALILMPWVNRDRLQIPMRLGKEFFLDILDCGENTERLRALPDRKSK
jgi:hypothetical protein